MERRDEDAVGRLAGQLTEESGHVFAVQAPERHATAVGLAGQLAEDLGERVPAVEL